MRGLRWDAVDTAAGVARLADSKTGPKVLALSEPALAVLATVPRFVQIAVRLSRPKGRRGRAGRHFRERAAHVGHRAGRGRPRRRAPPRSAAQRGGRGGECRRIASHHRQDAGTRVAKHDATVCARRGAPGGGGGGAGGAGGRRRTRRGRRRVPCGRFGRGAGDDADAPREDKPRRGTPAAGLARTVSRHAANGFRPFGWPLPAATG